MDAQQQQLAAAVAAAVSPTSTQELRAQAYAFLEQVRQNKLEAWSPCLGLFMSGAEDTTTRAWTWTYDQQARVFGLSVLDEVLLESFDQLEASHVEQIRQSLLAYARREFVEGDAEQGSSFAKNKVARTIFCLFLNTYATTWQSFFADFATLVRAQPSGAASTSTATSTLNAKAADLFLRILHEIALEISDTQLRLNKSYDRLGKDSELRDLIRANAASGLSTLLFEILRDTLAVVGQPPAGPLSAAGRPELVEHAARAIGDYVSWIDINLVINPATIPLLFQCLQAPQLSIVGAAVDALHETVAKGMPAADKLELVRVLNVVEVVVQLQAAAASRDADGDGETELRLRLAKLLNTVGLELTRAALDNAIDAERKVTVQGAVQQLLPCALRFLRDGDPNVSATSIPFLTSVLQDLKKQKKVANQRPPGFSDAQLAFLRELLETCVAKMEFDADADWNGVPDDTETDDNTAFLEMRNAMKQLFDAVAFVDEPMFAAALRSVLGGTFDALAAAGAAPATVPWQRVELALHLLYLYGEADKSRGAGLASMVEVPKAELERAKRNKEHRVDWKAYPLSPLGEFLMRAVRSPIASYPHPAVPLQFFECIVRYNELFNLAPDVIPTIFTAFVGERGLHNADARVQQRTCYLFSRFVTQGKALIQSHCPPAMLKQVVDALRDRLTVEVALSPADAACPDPLGKAAHSQSGFDSQAYVFEGVGQLVNSLQHHPQEQLALLRSVLDPLVAEIRSSVRTTIASLDDLVAVLRLHHLVIAIGSVCKGFPTLSAKAQQSEGQWPALFVQALASMLEALGALSAIAIVREATLSSFKVVVNATGTAVLPLVPTLINLLLDKLTATELVDFLPFIALLMHKYKADFAPLLDAIVQPLLARVYHYLAQPVTGTDDRVLHSELRRALYTLVTNIVNANQQAVFLSERNKPNFETFLQSLVYHLTHDAMTSDVRTAFGAFNRLSSAWVPPVNGSTDVSITVNNEQRPVTPVPGFERFVYDSVVPLCVSLPIDKAFDYSDGQSYLILGEMTALFKTLYARRGTEFTDFLSASLKSMQYPPAKADELVREVAGRSDWHELKKFYAPFAQEMRKIRLNALDAAAAGRAP